MFAHSSLRSSASGKLLLIDCPLFAAFRHRLEWLRIGESVIVADFNEDLWRQSAVGDEFFRVAERYHVVFAGVQDDRVRLDGRCCSPVLPRRAQENEWCVFGLDIQGNSAATGRTTSNNESSWSSSRKDSSSFSCFIIYP